MRLKSSLSPGPDGIPSVSFCHCSTVYDEPLASIFSRSLDDGIFPEVWKQFYMFPAFKNCDRREVRNYRGITNEKIVSSKSYISTDQHRFMPGRSVTTNLLVFIHVFTRSAEVYSNGITQFALA